MITEAIESDAETIMDVLEEMVLSTGDRYIAISRWREKCGEFNGDRWKAAARYLVDEGIIHRSGALVSFGGKQQ
jgi:hypothetical protein